MAEAPVNPQNNAESLLEKVKAGYGAEILKVLEDHTYELNITELKDILLKPEVADLPVVVVSVAGAFRLGKSFLLNFFLRFLTSPFSAQQNDTWIHNNSEKLTGFGWCSGSDRKTTGILMWSEPIITTLPSKEKVAIILMDTQGTFDSESTVRDCSTIFGLSTLLSSVQIYNLSENIKEDHLQHLQLFTDYGKQAQTGTTKPFQTLKFLVRDWSNDWEFGHGEEGGIGLLEKRFAITAKTAPEMKALREQLRSNFEMISGFLLPHPGLKVKKKEFQGNIADIEEPLFIEYLIQLVKSVLSPEKLLIKKINGEIIKARDLYKFFEIYLTEFNSDDLSMPKNIMQMTVTASLLFSKNKAHEVYTKGMDSECGSEEVSIPEADLQELHQKYMTSARDVFLKRKKMGSPEEANKYLEELIEELNDHFLVLEQKNNMKFLLTTTKAKEAYEDTINNASKGNQLCLHPLDLQQLYKEGVEVAMMLYDANRKIISSTVDVHRSQFEQSFEKSYETLQQRNEASNKSAESESLAMYSKFMEMKCALEPPLAEGEFKCEHESATATAIKNFLSKRNQPNSYSEDVHKQNLISDITAKFKQLNEMNSNIYKTTAEAVITQAITKARQEYEKGMQSECGPLQPSMPYEDIETLHRNYLNIAKKTFMDNVTRNCLENDYTRIIEDFYKEAEERLVQHRQNNDSKYQTTVKTAEEAYENNIQSISNGKPLCLHPTDLEKYHQLGVAAALKVFDANRKLVSSKTDNDKLIFETSFEKKFSKYDLLNKQNNQTIINELQSKYWKSMETKCALSPPLTEEKFKSEHDSAYRDALKEFDSKRNCPKTYNTDIFRDELKKIMTDSFTTFKLSNTTKRLEHENIKKEQAENKIKHDNLMLEQERNRIEKELIRENQAKFEAEQLKLQKAQEKRIAEHDMMMREQREMEAIERQRQYEKEAKREKRRQDRDERERAEMIAALRSEREKNEEDRKLALKEQRQQLREMEKRNKELADRAEELENEKKERENSGCVIN